MLAVRFFIKWFRGGGMMRRFLILQSSCFVLLSSVVFAEWHVADAPLRATVALQGSPSHSSAGHILVIPDGGILPGSKVDIVTGAGAKLKSALLWHSRANGLVVVFGGGSSSDKIYAYISSGKSPIWTPASGLTPSPYFATDPTIANISAAKALAAMGPVKPTVYFGKMQSYSVNRFSAGYVVNDFSGRPVPYSVYALTHLAISEAGKVFFSPEFGPGASAEVRINGKVIGRNKVHSAWGGVGDHVDLTKGVHICEVFYSCAKPPAKLKGSGYMFLRIKLPGEKYKDLDGVWGDKPPPGCKKGEPQSASRIIRSSEVVKSGKCKVRGFERKNGMPVASFSVTAMESCFGLADGPPAIVYQLKANAEGNPEDTVYTWKFADGGQSEGTSVVRFFDGFREHKVMLIAESKTGKSSCAIPFYGYTDVSSSLDNSRSRSAFRSAFLGTIRSFPSDKDATAMWSPNMWACFHASQELGKGEALLADILTKRWKQFKARMTEHQQEMLKIKFFQFISYFNTEKAFAWLKQAERATPDMEERKLMKIWMAEVYMYQLNDFEKAKRLLKEVARSGRGSDAAAFAKIRLGDVAFLERDVNMANTYWGAVQNNVDVSEDLLGGKTGGKTLKLASGLRKPKSRAEKEAERKAAARTKQKNKGGFSSAIKSGNTGVPSWRQAAVMDTTMATEVISLMEQGFWDEAYVNLHRWERAFPLSKMSGDYIIQDALYYEKTGNVKRARALLVAYCDNVEASAFLANAVGNLLSLMINARDEEKVVKEFCEVMKKRFEFHPLAERLNDMLSIYGADGVKREFIKVEF